MSVFTLRIWKDRLEPFIRWKMRCLIWVHTVCHSSYNFTQSLTRRLSSGLEDKYKVKIRDVDIYGKYGIKKLSIISHENELLVQKPATSVDQDHT